MKIFIVALLSAVSFAGLAHANANDAAVAQLIERLRSEIAPCWMMPPINGEIGIVVIDVELKRDGSLAREPTVENPSSDAQSKIVATSAVRALHRCAPFKSVKAFPYRDWQQLRLRFDPQTE
jgi:hypothetical protein